MDFGLPPEIRQALRRELQKEKNVIRAVIFGSRAQGNYKYNSDIDLAVYSQGELSPKLLQDLDEAAGIYKIDIIDMNVPLGKDLQDRIEKEGVEYYRR